MILLISKHWICRLSIRIIGILLMIFIYLLGISKTSPVYVYGFKGAPDESREYWVNSEDIYWDVQIPDKFIALTFDDGPHPAYTPQILEILSTHNIRATFFVLGKQISQYPEVLQMIAKNGNEIANHTYSHPRMRMISPSNLVKEIDKTHQLIHELTGKEPVLFRPPGGYYNKRIVESVRQINYKIILWSFTQDTRDWSNPGVRAIVDGVLKNAKSGDIVIFHDSGGNRTQTVQAVELIIEGLKQDGFNMITVSELLEIRKAQHVN